MKPNTPFALKSFVGKQRFPLFLLILGFTVVFSLYFLKLKAASTNEVLEESLLIEEAVWVVRNPQQAVPHRTLELPSHAIYLATDPISCQQFAAFSQAMGYSTWREHYGLLPNWRFPSAVDNSSTAEQESWKKHPIDPALWLVLEDAEAFCTWMGDQLKLPSPYTLENTNEVIWKNKGIRLPTVDEL